jgi:hypothetical protein
MLRLFELRSSFSVHGFSLQWHGCGFSLHRATSLPCASLPLFMALQPSWQKGCRTTLHHIVQRSSYVTLSLKQYVSRFLSVAFR